MAYEVKDLTGSLFKNQKKTDPKHADYGGSGLIEGVAYWVDAWVRESERGKKFMSLRFKQKNAPAAKRDFDDDL
jgi:hypothetical protein